MTQRMIVSVLSFDTSTVPEYSFAVISIPKEEPLELVAPAGNTEKLRYAFLYGADAVYMGIRSFSLRARAENLRDDEQDLVRRIKAGRRLFGALNISFHQADLRELERRIEEIASYPFDAVIVSDIGVVPLLRRHLPHMPLHLSTQANCVNAEAARMYRDMGFRRIVPGRELSLREMEEIRSRVDVELEVFVHGAMCLAYSGRCFLSRYMAGRSANRGDCAHSCRWRYRVLEECERVLEEAERPGEYFPVVEGDGFTTLLSSRDLCLIDHLDRLRSAGVDALKIEGRMKSVYYTALVTRAYRKALDHLEGRSADPPEPYRDDMLKVSHRELSTGFLFGREQIESPTEREYVRSTIFLGTVEEQIDERTFRIEVKNRIGAGDTLEYVGFDVVCIGDSGFRLLDEEMRKVDWVNHGTVCYLRTDRPIKEGYIIRRSASG